MSTRARLYPVVLLLAVALPGCRPAPGLLVPLHEGDTWTFRQLPDGATLTLSVAATTAIDGAPYRQVHATLTEGGRLRDAGHLYIRQTDEGLFWRLTDSAHTLFPPGLLRYPAPWRGAYTHGGSEVRVAHTTAAWQGQDTRALSYTVASDDAPPLRLAFIPGEALVEIERGPFRFELVDVRRANGHE